MCELRHHHHHHHRRCCCCYRRCHAFAVSSYSVRFQMRVLSRQERWRCARPPGCVKMPMWVGEYVSGWMSEPKWQVLHLL
jgi:hypothetical protein